MIEQSAWRSDDEMPPALKLLHLTLYILSTVYGQHFYAVLIVDELADFLRNLQSQLACRRHNKPLNIGLAHIDSLQHRKQKRERLACTRLRLRHDVFARQHDGNCLLLNGRRNGNAVLFQSLIKFLLNP